MIIEIENKSSINYEIDKNKNASGSSKPTQTKEVTPTKETQIVKADMGYELESVTINSIPNEYVIPSGTIDITSNGIANVSGYENANINVEKQLFLQSKNVIPSKEIQNIIADENYDALLNVVVEPIPSEYTIPSGTLDITTNGIHNVKNYESANVKVVSAYINDPVELFANNRRLEEFDTIIPLISPNATNFTSIFNNSTTLVTAPYIDLSNATNVSEFFYLCRNLTSVPLYNTSKVTNFKGMFQSCTALKKPPAIDTSSATTVNSLFQGSGITEAPYYDFSNATTADGIFSGCTSLVTIAEYNLGKATRNNGILYNCTSLVNIGGLKDLGKGFTQYTAANSSYQKVDVSNSTLLTHESLINLINGLYDLVSSGRRTQQLVLGTTNLAKLTEEEIAIAQTKGWTVS